MRWLVGGSNLDEVLVLVEILVDVVVVVVGGAKS